MGLRDRVVLRPGAEIAEDRKSGRTDCVASTPVFVLADGSDTRLVGSSEAMEAVGQEQPQKSLLSQLSMAGYTIGRKTAGSKVTSLKPGESARIEGDQVRLSRDLTFAPDLTMPESDEEPGIVATALMATIERMIASFGSREPTIMLPLSAGLDSRAIASALAEIGYRKVRCFSYGLPGNHEAIAAKTVADKLGYPWSFVSTTSKSQRRFFNSELFSRFCQFAARPDAMPFVQDVSTLETLMANGDIPEDCVFVNGQSGDYLTGNHIPSELSDPSLNGTAGVEAAFNATVSKHFDLWQHLKTSDRLNSLKQTWEADLQDSLGHNWREHPAYVLFELSEYDNRQAKYVVAGQRAYEFFGLDWRLPLWDAEFVLFWKQMPLKGRLQQAAYRRALTEANWGGVWGSDWNFGRHVVPRWVRPLRFAAKIAASPFGRRCWHQFDKRVFAWWIDPVQNYQIVPWTRTITDRNGFRNGLSFHAEAFLQRQGWDK